MIMSKEAKNRRKRFLSLRFKSVAAILLGALILSVVSVMISYSVYSTTMSTHYKTLASHLAKTAASQLSAEDLLRYYDEVKKIPLLYFI